MTRVLVGIPWRHQPHRVYAHDLTVQRYEELLPDATVLDFDTEHEQFCLAGARNLAVRFGERVRADVIVLADADTLPEREPLLAAIEGAAHSSVVHLPYTEYRSLRRDGTDQFLVGVPLQECSHLVVDGACSGVYVTTPATWGAHGGQDERFRGWSPEDAAWMAAHTTLLGDPVRHSGRVYALHHDSPPKTGPDHEAGYALVYRYHQAQGDLAAMRRLIAEAETCNKSTSATGG
ncbi:hypothetical protein [Actinomadura rubrisoli]|uniref:Galactosyltransferase C-terminal domain-containing protein n=1 Tax=Actinomadura rubrisoli TaxID=2530368 RepID=A0A4R5CF47_9ACTN|nr:hypothetical protein [Actinomadura rubrisoli]TDD97629.1 hypothetical protein E1298_00940 [Actinomadura rubrisoli]